jgi:hypothetical protein
VHCAVKGCQPDFEVGTGSGGDREKAPLLFVTFVLPTCIRHPARDALADPATAGGSDNFNLTCQIEEIDRIGLYCRGALPGQISAKHSRFQKISQPYRAAQAL